MYDCRQLEDVSIVENVHIVTEILYQILLGAVTSIINQFVPKAFGVFELKGTTLYDFISYVHI